MPTWRETLAPLLASSSSGVLARFPCHPLDTCKARLQVQGSSQNKYTSLFDTLTKTARAEGMKGLYRGFGITVIGSAPATCLYLTSYDAAKTSHSIDGHDCGGEPGRGSSYTYKGLAEQTGGTNFELCATDWTPYFSVIAGAVGTTTVGSLCIIWNVN